MEREYNDLTAGEARLLLVYRDNPVVTNKDAMRLSGIDATSRFFHARKALRNLGLLDVPLEEPRVPKEPNSAKVGRIMRAYSAAFKGDISPAQGGMLLKEADVDEVIQLFREVKDRNIHKPFLYTLAILKGRKETPIPLGIFDRAVVSREPFDRPVPPKPTPVPVPVPLSTDELKPVTPTYLKELERLKKVKTYEWE